MFYSLTQYLWHCALLSVLMTVPMLVLVLVLHTLTSLLTPTTHSQLSYTHIYDVFVALCSVAHRKPFPIFRATKHKYIFLPFTEYYSCICLRTQLMLTTATHPQLTYIHSGSPLSLWLVEGLAPGLENWFEKPRFLRFF